MRFAEPETTSAASRWTSRIALFSLLLIITAFFLHRLLGMPTPIAYNLVLTAYGGVALSLLIAAVAAVGIWRHDQAGTARVMFSLLLCLGMLAGPLLLMALARDYPPINDVTTDFSSPPRFETLARVRGGPGGNPVAYPGQAFAVAQARGYPDLKPLMVDRSSDEVFELVVDAVKKLKMEIVREDGPGAETGTPGMIEAVDRTLVAGFYDDIAIRVASAGEKARVDIRSASRFGSTDFGNNAERVRELMREIVARLDATVPTAEEARAKGGKLKRAQEDDPKSGNRRKSRDRAQSDAQRGQAQKARRQTPKSGRSSDRRPVQSLE